MYRIARLAVPACATVFLLGCESPTAPQGKIQRTSSQQPLSVEITGPSQINAEGTYSWNAFAFGGSGSYQYQWDVTRHANGAVQTITQQNLSLHVLESDGNFSLNLTVRSGSEVISQNRDVTNCISRCRYLVPRK